MGYIKKYEWFFFIMKMKKDLKVDLFIVIIWIKILDYVHIARHSYIK